MSETSYCDQSAGDPEITELLNRLDVCKDEAARRELLRGAARLVEAVAYGMAGQTDANRIGRIMQIAVELEQIAKHPVQPRLRQRAQRHH